MWLAWLVVGWIRLSDRALHNSSALDTYEARALRLLLACPPAKASGWRWKRTDVEQSRAEGGRTGVGISEET